MVFAVLVSPLLAVQADKYLSRKREEKQRKLDVFRTLMATRAAGLSPAHVDALNRIDIEFHDNARVSEAWKAYLDHLNDRSLTLETWNARRLDFVADLLHAMSNSLGYNFDKTHLKRATYYPQGYGDIEQDQQSIRKGLVEVLGGQKSLPMSITSLPGSDADFAEQAKLRKLMLRHYKGELALEMKVVRPEDPRALPSPLAPRREGSG
jgi:hypothetical protein